MLLQRLTFLFCMAVLLIMSFSLPINQLIYQYIIDLCGRMLKKIRFCYVSTHQIEIIKKQALSSSLWSRIKAELKVGKFIMSQGYKQAKKQISFFYRNYSSPNLTCQEKRRMHLTKSNILKVPPIAILFCFPGGLPIVLLYMAFLPALTPSWFLKDVYQHKQNQDKLFRQRNALRYFVDCNSIIIGQNSKQIKTSLTCEVFENMSLNEQKKVMQLCFGDSFDGSNIIRKITGLSLNCFLFPDLSRLIMRFNLFERLKLQQNPSEEGEDKLRQKVIKQAERIVRKQEEKVGEQI